MGRQSCTWLRGVGKQGQEGSMVGRRRLSSVSRSCLPLPGLHAVLCKGGHKRWTEGHYQGPQQGQADTEWGRGAGRATALMPTHDTPLRVNLQLPQPPGAPLSTFPQEPCTLTPSQLWSTQACGTGRHPQSYQGLLSSMGSVHSILVVMGPGDRKAGPGGGG